MLYAGFMPAAPPPLPQPQENAGPPELLQLGTGTDEEEPCLRADAARNRAGSWRPPSGWWPSTARAP